MRVTARVESIVVPRGRHLHRLEVLFRGETTDDEREVVRRARRRAQRLDLLLQKLNHAFGVQKRLGLLVQKRLIRGTAAFRLRSDRAWELERRGLRRGRDAV